MDKGKTAARLCAIRDAYAEIRDVSQAASDLSSNDELTAIIQRRSRLLDRISEYQEGLNGEEGGWQHQSDGAIGAVVQQIRELITIITERDKKLQQIVQARLDSIKNELFSLPSMARAAVAYTGHASPSYRRNAVP